MRSSIETGFRAAVAGLVTFTLSQFSDGRPIDVQAEEIKPQTSQTQVQNQEMCSQQVTWMKKKDGTLSENKNGCIPKDGAMPHPEGILFFPNVHIK